MNWLDVFAGVWGAVVVAGISYGVIQLAKDRREKFMTELTARIVAALEEGKKEREA